MYVFFEDWFNFFVLIIIVFTGIILYVAFMDSKPGILLRNLFYKSIYPVAKIFKDLSFTTKRIINGFTLTIYYLGLIIVFAYIFGKG